MGQQQLLLLVLSVVIVALAVVVGIEAFGKHQRSFRQEQTVHIMMDLAAKAQLWKITPPPLGGGDGSPEGDFSDFTLAAVGLESTEVQGTNEVVLRTEYACLKLFPATDRLRIHALDTACTNGSWWMALHVTGTSSDDVVLQMNGDPSAINGNGQ